ncbi:hypothetical protein RCL1_008666 [Eukaryota sp. TZLM3-RCL]
MSLQFLYGTSGGAVSTLITVADYFILLDCGWDLTQRNLIFSTLETHASKIDAVIISNPSPEFCGALPLLVDQFKYSGPIFMSHSSFKLAHLNLYALILSLPSLYAFDPRPEPTSAPYNLDSIDLAFTYDRISTTVFGEPASISTKTTPVSLTPFRAGGIPGGTIWSLSVSGYSIYCPTSRQYLLRSFVPPMSPGSIIYAPKFTHRSEKFTVPDEVARPNVSLVVTTADVAYDNQQSKTISLSSRKKRDQLLIDSVKKTLINQGNVVINSDVTGRVVEICGVLNSAWEDIQTSLNTAIPLFLISPVSRPLFQFLKSMLVDINPNLMDNFDLTRVNPFDFEFVIPVSDVEEMYSELEENYMGPIVVINCVTCRLVELSPAMSLIVDWARDSNNLIIDTELDYVVDCPVSRQLSVPSFTQISRDQSKNQSNFDLYYWDLEPLSGEALRQYQVVQESKQREGIEEQVEEMESVEIVDDSQQSNLIVSYPIDVFFGRLVFPRHVPQNIAVDSFGMITDLNQIINHLSRDQLKTQNLGENLEIVEESEDESLPKHQVLQVFKNFSISCSNICINFSTLLDVTALTAFIKKKNPTFLTLINAPTEVRTLVSENLTDTITNIVTPANGDVAEVPFPQPPVPVLFPLDSNEFDLINVPNVLAAVVPRHQMDKITGFKDPLVAATPLEFRKSVLIKESVTVPSVTEISNYLKAHGFVTTVSRGVLTVDNLVIQRSRNKSDLRAFSVSGPVSGNYFRVKKLIDQFVGKRI